MDLAAKHVNNLQDLTHQAQQHQADQQRQVAESHQSQHLAFANEQAEATRAQQVHEAELRRTAAAHEAEMQRMHQKHALTMKHQQELNEQKVAAAKALAAAKPKKPKKAA
jgi:hypothetical protein